MSKEPKPKAKRKRKPVPAQARAEPPEDRPRGKTGPVSGYTPEHAIRVRDLAKQGALLSEIADILGINRKTLTRWRHQFPELNEALMIGREAANQRVEMSLYQQALGYWIETEEIKVIETKVVRVPTRTFIVPNVTAAIWWTKARMGWRDDLDPGALPGNDGKTIENIPDENPRQKARRIAFVLLQGGRDDEKKTG